MILAALLSAVATAPPTADRSITDPSYNHGMQQLWQRATDLLVHFREWHPHDELVRMVRARLSGQLLPRSFAVLRRSSVHSGAATDFIAIRTKTSNSAATARRRLLTDPAVAGVSPQRRYSRRKLLTSDGEGAHKHRLAGQTQPYNFVTQSLNASRFWRAGATGAGVRIAIFDTGLGREQVERGGDFLRHPFETIDFTDEGTTDDRVGHSTFMAGTIASVGGKCAGFAPDAELLFMRVFDSQQESTTSWFLDAFNHLLRRSKAVDLINLSVGGPDFRDAPFASKLRELARAGVTVVSGAGNSGPGWGTLLNPADDASVIGVGGLDAGGALAEWSSRGPTLWEQPHGEGRAGVDVVTYGEFWAAQRGGGCQHQYGTSVACPVVVGVLALLLSSLTPPQRLALRNPAALKQVLASSSEPLGGVSYLEQGSGVLRPTALHAAMLSFSPHASAIPPSLELVGSTCDYMAPLCMQPIYAGMQPLLVNLTIVDSARHDGVIARRPAWVPADTASADALEIRFAYRRRLSTWVGYLGVEISVRSSASRWGGIARGRISLEVCNDDGAHDQSDPRGTGTDVAGDDEAAEGVACDDARTIDVPLSVRVVATPPRARRLVVDLYHSSGYPVGFFPTDDLSTQQDELMDSRGDHPYTNYRTLVKALASRGFFIEVLRGDWLSFDASRVGALLLLDAEEPYTPLEAAKLQDDLGKHGLGLLVAADWYSPSLMAQLDYTDAHTQVVHRCASGGANVPSLNGLLEPFGVAFAQHAYTGSYELWSGQRVDVSSGAAIVAAPTGAVVVSAPLERLLDVGKAADGARPGETGRREHVGVVALCTAETRKAAATASPDSPASRGWILALADASCLDDEPAASGTCIEAVALLISQVLSSAKNGVGLAQASLLRSRHAAELRRPLRSSVPEAKLIAEGMSSVQSRAHRVASRVWSRLRNCTRQSKTCTLPLVPPLSWMEPRSLGTMGHTQEQTHLNSEQMVAAADVSHHFHVVLWFEAALILLCGVLIVRRITRRSGARRQTNSHSFVPGR